MRVALSNKSMARLTAGLGAGLVLLAGLVMNTAEAAWPPLPATGQSAINIGERPEAISLAADARVLVVGNNDAPGLTVVHPDTGAIIAKVALPTKPRALALNSAGTTAYAVTEESGVVTAVDIGTASISATWPVGGKLSSLALRQSDNELVVADEEGKRLVGLNLSDGGITRQLTLPEAPNRLAIADNGLRLMVGNKHGRLFVLDAGTWNMLRTITVGDEIRDLAWWETGGLALIVQRNPDGMSLIDINKGIVSARIGLDGDPQQIALDHGKRVAYVSTSRDFSINAADLGTLALKGRYSMPSNAGGVVFDPVTLNLFATFPKDNLILRLDPMQNSLITVLQLQKKLRDIKVNNRTHQAVAIADKPNELYVVGLADKSTRTVNLGARPNLLAVDATKNIAVVAAKAGGEKLLFVDLGAGTLYPERISAEIRALAIDEARGVTVALTDGGALVIDNAVRAQTASLKLAGTYRDVAVHTGRGLAYLVAEDKKLAIISLDNQAIVNQIALPFRARQIAIDPELDRAVLLAEQDDQAHVLDLATLQITHSFAVPKHPEAVAIQPDTHVAVIASKKSGQLSLLDLTTNTLTTDFAPLDKPFALTTSTKYNQVLVLTAERDDVSFVQLPNTTPVLTEITPRDSLVGGAALTLKVKGKYFVDGSKVLLDNTSLTTRWIDNGQLEADLPANLLAQAKLFSVTVSNPGPVGGTSQSLTFSVLNPAPVLQAVAPMLLKASGESQILTLTGSNFMSGSVVYFGAQPLATTYQSAGKLTAVVPGALLKASGTVPVTVQNPLPGGGASAPVQVQVANSAPTVTSFTPDNGPVGTAVSITGTNFDALNPGANDVRFNGERAVVTAATATQLKAIVPLRALTGPVSVTTQSGGSATGPGVFTVKTQQDFDVSFAPNVLQLPRGAGSSFRVSLASVGTAPYQQTVGLTVTGLPAGVSYKLDRANLYFNHDVIVTLSASADAAPGAYAVNLVATGAADLATRTHTKPFTITVLDAGTTTVSGRVIHAEDDRPFVGARIRLGSQETVTDGTGYYRFVNPDVVGDRVLLVDGHTAATDKWNYPSAIAVPVMIVAGQDNVALTSYIQAIDTSKFTTITPGAETHVTVPEIPNYELRIPAGAVLMGWDGTPITKVNVRTVSVDRLPIKPLPPEVNAKTVYLYYFFREGGANPSRPIPVTMNNDIGALPGDKVDMWYYDESITPDPNSNQWRIMGKGTVSQDGKSIVSDPGVGIPKFCCGATTASNPAPPPPPPNEPCAGNPVSLSSGAATVLDSKPFGIQGGKFPVNLSCGYSSVNPTVGFFGLGTYFNYDWRATRSGTSAISVIAPNGERYNLVLEGDGVYRAKEGRANGIGMEATIASEGIQLRRTNGMLYQFDSAGFLVAQQDPSGNRITISRNSNNYVTGIIDANGRHYSIATSTISIGRVTYTVATSITDPLGRTQKYKYDTQARLVSVSDTADQVTSYEYDSGNRIVKKTDSRGAVTQYAYDAAGRAVQEILPDGAVYRFDYTVAGNTITETRVTDPNGNVTTHRFNGQGIETKTIDALGRQTTKQVDFVTNLVTAETDPAGRTTRYTYDERGNRTSIVDPEGNTTLIEYDQQWNKPTKITNALGVVTTMEYDARGNLIKTVNGEGEGTTFTYTAAGKLKSITDALNHTTTLDYDGEGNLVKATDALGNVEQARYDVANRLVESINPRGRSQSYSYDTLDRLTQTIDALGGKTQYSFDAQENLLSVVDANDHAIETNLYDLRNRLTRRTDANSRSEQFEYDANGNLVRHTDRKGQATSYKYDALNRIVFASDVSGRSTGYSYDLAGNLNLISDSESGDILLGYDRLNRLVQVSTNQGVIGYHYDALDRKIQRTINGADSTDYVYDKANRIKSITYRGKSVSYSYGKTGRLVQKVLPDGISQHLEYNAANRLTGLAYKKADGSVIENIVYTYDENGNRISRSSLANLSAPETPFTATYDATNRMTSYNGYALTYDDNGNLVQRRTAHGTVTYSWDAQNRLIQIQGPHGTASFKYDALGRRIEKTVNGATVQYLYDGDQAIAELQGSAIGATYLTGLQIDEVLARYSNGQSRQLLTDALGSVIAQVDQAGAMQTGYTYSPYGETLVHGPNDGNAVQYTARENDGTGLYYYRARYYDPQLKRFISSDPIGLAGGINIYAYVEGNPILYIDPEGLLITSTLGGLQRGVTSDQAASLGAPGNAAAAAGGATAAAAAAAAAGGAGYARIPSALKRIPSLIKEISDEALPPPMPPKPPTPTPPAIVRPGNISPPKPPPGICPK